MLQVSFYSKFVRQNKNNTEINISNPRITLNEVSKDR